MGPPNRQSVNLKTYKISFLGLGREMISLLWKRNKKTHEIFLHILACRLVLVTITTVTKKARKKDDYTLEEFEG